MKSWCVVLVIPLLACARGESSSDPAVAPTVTVQAVVEDTISEVVPVSGRLTPLPGASALLTAPADAVVRSVRVQVGDRVAPGEVLLDLDAPELTTAAEAMAAQAHSDSLDLVRQQGLYEQGITSRKQLEERQAAAAASRAQAAAAASLRDRARVVSPIAGGVQRLTVQGGERVSAGQLLAEVVNGAALDFHAGVPAAPLTRLRIGQPVALTGEGSGEPVAGRLVAIAPAIDSVSGMGEVVIRVATPGGLRAGSGASGSILLRQLTKVLVVPDSALVPGEAGLQVFVMGADSIVRGHPVTVAVRSGGRAAITGDVKPGDHVIVSGAYGLTDSTRVRPVAP